MMHYLFGTLLFLVVAVSANKYYVTPSPNTTCFEDGLPCFTFFEYANGSIELFQSNANVTTLILLPGNHNLNSDMNLKTLVSNSTSELNIFGQNASNTTIICSQSSRIVIENASSLKVKIEGIKIKCTGTKMTLITEFVLRDVTFFGPGQNGIGLRLSQVSTVNIARSSFKSFAGGMLINETRNIQGGGALVVQNCQKVSIEDSEFAYNNVDQSFEMTKVGGALFAFNSSVHLSNCTFDSNSLSNNSNASYGGAVYVNSSNLTMESCVFKNNSIHGISNRAILSEGYGGAVYVTGIRKSRSTVSFIDCKFIDNSLINITNGSGGAVYITEPSHFKMESCEFEHNFIHGMLLESYGGAVYATKSSGVSIIDCRFNDNFLSSYALSNGHAYGGAVYLTELYYHYYYDYEFRIPTLNGSTFIGNSIINQTSGEGGAMYVNDSNVHMENCVFHSNSVICNHDGKGGAIYVVQSYWFTVAGTLNIMHNSAKSGVVYARESYLDFIGELSFVNNTGSLFFTASTVWIDGIAVFTNNSVHDLDLLEGGAMTVQQSQIYLNGNISFTHNTARHGGALLLAFESEVHIESGDIIISDNNASEIGGGIHCIYSSSIKVFSSSFKIFSNYAKNGGGISLARNSELFIYQNGLLNLFDNWADYGGAIYVSDATNLDACNSDTEPSGIEEYNCFFHFKSSTSSLNNASDSAPKSINFTNNHANMAGNILYGGFLDRCTPTPADYITDVSVDAASNFLQNTNLEHQDLMNSSKLSSKPVRVCFCKDNHPDCDFSLPAMTVYKGESFNVSLVAVDQLNNVIPSTIVHAYISVLEAHLGEHQSMQITDSNETCTTLTYRIFSPHSIEELIVYAEGPCGKQGISASHLNVSILPCPIGFSESSKFHCDCDLDLYPKYVSSCSIENTSVVRKGDTWFGIDNSTENYSLVLYENCPYDYCVPSSKKVVVDLSINLTNGSDALCFFQRSGRLCGSCKDGLSLTFGGSQCMECSNKWLAMIFVFAIAGFLLVAIILVCNLTVAAGTINGLIFYANIIEANRFVFLPFSGPNVLTIFIAWINLDFGIISCFYDGMDEYAKTWLQFVFPTYILFMVAMVFLVAEYWSRFARVLHKYCHDPVAALSTLVLLSYTKFFRIIVVVFSRATLIRIYSNGSNTTEDMWLSDANIEYNRPSRIPLILASIIMLLIGMAYTLLLLFWHWLDSENFKMKVCFKWILRSSKLRDFVKTYQDPYQHDHHYWTGLLLLVRVLLYSVLSICDYYYKASIAVLVIFCCLLLFKDLTGSLYKKRMLNILDTSYNFNLLLFAALTVPLKDFSERGHIALACISVGVCFITFLATVCYHVYKYMLNQEKVQTMVQKIKRRPDLPSKRQHLRKISMELLQAANNQLQSPLIIPNKSITSSTKADSFSEVGTPEIEDTMKDLIPYKPRKQLELKVMLKIQPSTRDDDKSDTLIDKLEQFLKDLDVEDPTVTTVCVTNEPCSTLKRMKL